jgi:hypothetical protein
MASFNIKSPRTIAIACIFPLLLAACGSSASSPSAGTSASTGSGSGSSGGSTGTVASTGTDGTGGTGDTGGGGTDTGATPTTLTGTIGNTGGGLISTVGTTVTATGASLQNNALNNPVGITVLNNGTPGTGAGNVVDANVLSNTAPSTAPIQANVLSNGQIVSASIANPTAAKIPVVTPLVDGLPTIVSAVPAGSPVAGAISNLTHGTVGTSGITPAVSGLTAPLTSAVAPLNQALNVKLGTTQLLGNSSTPALINADVVTPTKTLSVGVTQPGGSSQNPLSALTSTLSGNALTGALTK